MKFELRKETAKLVDVNPRAELHGEATKPAGDLKLRVMLPAAELIQLHPNLRSMLYEKSNNPDLVDAATGEANSLRFPQIGLPIKWAGEIVGAEVTIHHGISAKSDLVLDGCLVNEMRLEPLEGGSVATTFRVQCHPDEKAFGRLCAMTGTEIVVSVFPPADAPQGSE
jgi:hypothetical protein